MAADAFSTRRNEDLAKLKVFAAQYSRAVRITKVTGSPVSRIDLELDLPTARNEKYPMEVQDRSDIRIELPSKYPLAAPAVTVSTAIWNPNIYRSGLICLGSEWVVTENLALLVNRVMQIITLHPAVINVKSPANRDAADWYTTSTKKGVRFPTTDLDSIRTPAPKKMVWKDLR